MFSNTQPGVHDYLCNKLYELPESALEKYLLQLTYLAFSKPGQQLERTIIDLCSKSFRIAVKVRTPMQPRYQTLAAYQATPCGPPAVAHATLCSPMVGPVL